MSSERDPGLSDPLGHRTVERAVERSLSILLFAKDRVFTAILFDQLRDQHIEMVCAHCLDDDLLPITRERYDVILLDENLSGPSAASILRLVQEEESRPPVLVLTSDGALDRRIGALEAGADDCLGRPFEFKELIVRIRVLARRKPVVAGHARLKVGEIEIDRIKRVVLRNGKPINLQSREFDLLSYLASNAGRVLSRSMLLENVWNLTFDPQTNIVETHISRLRAKIDHGFPTKLVRTVRGVGYMVCSKQ